MTGALKFVPLTATTTFLTSHTVRFFFYSLDISEMKLYRLFRCRSELICRFLIRFNKLNPDSGLDSIIGLQIRREKSQESKRNVKIRTGTLKFCTSRFGSELARCCVRNPDLDLKHWKRGLGAICCTDLVSSEFSEASSCSKLGPDHCDNT